MAKVIWTKNALRRIHEVNLSQGIVYDAIYNSDRSFPGHEPGITQFKKERDFGLITVIAKKINGGDWLVISCDLRPSKQFSSRPSGKTEKMPILRRILKGIMKFFGLSL